MRDSNPPHPRCKRGSSTTEPTEQQDVTPTPSPVCTSNPENDNAGAPDADPLAKLAAALLTLSPVERERLAAMLTGHQGEGEGRTG